MPLDNSGRLDRDQHLQTARPQSVEKDLEQAIESKQTQPSRPMAAKNVQLTTQDEVL